MKYFTEDEITEIKDMTQKYAFPSFDEIIKNLEMTQDNYVNNGVNIFSKCDSYMNCLEVYETLNEEIYQAVVSIYNNMFDKQHVKRTTRKILNSEDIRPVKTMYYILIWFAPLTNKYVKRVKDIIKLDLTVV